MTVALAAFGLVILIVAGLVVFSAYTNRRVKKLLPPMGEFMDVDGTRLHYVDKGKGPPIVLIHGLGGQTRHYTYALVDRLSPRFRVIAFDRPGSGYSTRTASTTGLHAHAGIIAKAIAKLGLDRPLIVGHSMGGAVALAIAVEHPEAAGSLALLAPLTHPVTTPPDAFKALVITSKFMRWAIGWTLAVPMSILQGEKVLALVFGPEKSPVDFPMRGGGLMSLRPGSFETASADVVAANPDLGRIVPRYGSLTLPLHILYGIEDQILDHKEQGLKMKTVVPQTQIELLQGRGHMLPITAVEESVQFISKVADERAITAKL